MAVAVAAVKWGKRLRVESDTLQRNKSMLRLVGKETDRDK